MISEKIVVIANGEQDSRWEAVTIHKNVLSIKREFTLQTGELSRRIGSSVFSEWKYPPCTLIDIYVSDGPSVLNLTPVLLGGIVFDYDPIGDSTSHQVTVHGYGREFETARSAPIHETGTFEDKTVGEIAKELVKPLDLDFRLFGKDSALVEVFQTRKGSTIYNEISRVASPRGMIITGSFEAADGDVAAPNGRLDILGPGTFGFRHPGGLYQGQNIERMAAHISLNGVFGKTVGIGQNSRDDDSLDAFGEADIAGLCSKAVKEIVIPAESKSEMLRTYAIYDALQSIGLSRRAIITVPSWRDEARQIWRPGAAVHVYAPWLKLDQDMIIAEVEFRQDSQSGTAAELSLCDPRIFGATIDAENSDGAWFGDGPK
jgi:prophage tail gpP-like protein